MFKEKGLLLSALVFLLMVPAIACQVPIGLDRLGLGQAETPSVKWPHSAFVQHLAVRVVNRDQQYIETYHASHPGKLGKLSVTVNDQPIAAGPGLPENLAKPAAVFTSTLATVAVMIGNEPIRAAAVAPLFPTSSWPVSLLWIGHVPGRYVIQMVVTDEYNRPSNVIIQPIEVR